MQLSHHGIKIVLLDEWWAEAEMVGFTPISVSYSFDQNSNQEINEVRIEDVGPVHRDPLFRDGSEGEGTARERVVRILRDFRLGNHTHPVEIIEGKLEYSHRYMLTHGAHRFYCSLAAGYTYIPTVRGFDITALDN